MKKLNVKSFTMGLIIGSLMMSIIGVSAASGLKYTLVKTSYNTKISGKVYNDTKNPILSMNNVNYIPLTASVSNDLNIDTNINTKTKSIDINTDTPKEVVYYMENDKDYVEVDGKKYISLFWVATPQYELNGNILNFFNSKSDMYNDKPSFSNVPYTKIKKDIYVDYDFYTKEIQSKQSITLKTTQQKTSTNSSEINLELGETYTNGDFSITLKEVKNTFVDKNGKVLTKLLIYEIKNPIVDKITPHIVKNEKMAGFYSIGNDLYQIKYVPNYYQPNPWVEYRSIKVIWNVDLMKDME